MKAFCAPAKLDLTQLVIQHQTMVWRYLRLLGCESALADDLTQETFLSILKKPFIEINTRATAAYLRLVAKNLFIDEMRRLQKNIPSDLDQAEVVWNEAGGHHTGQIWLEALRDCLQLLERRPYQALELQYQKKLSIHSIAESLGMKESGVKTLLGRAKQRLRECVERKVSSK